jgi:hypothetical protein
MTANDDIRKLIKEVSGVDLPPDAPPEEPVVIRRPEDMPYYWHNKAFRLRMNGCARRKSAKSCGASCWSRFRLAWCCGSFRNSFR